MSKTVNSKILAMKLTTNIAESRIRTIAEKTENIIFGNHARQRMVEREIFDVDVLRIIRKGDIEGYPEQTDSKEWKCKLTLKVRGSRTAGVVVIILRKERLFVKTVEWEDLS